jgi:hypothetical protein
MDPRQLLSNGLTKTFERLKQHLDDFSDADLMTRPVPAANHANWQIGHLAGIEVKACNQLGLKIDAPADVGARYAKDLASSDDASKFLKKDELIKILGETNAALSSWIGSMPPEDLSKPAPEPFRQWAPTNAALASLFPGHTAMHIGQIQVLRRKLGKKVLF